MKPSNKAGYVFFIGGALAMMSTTLSSYGIATVTPALLTQFNAMQHYTLTSLMASIGMLLFLPIVGKLVDTIGRKPLLIVGALTMLISSVAAGLAQNFVFFIVMRALISVGSACLTVLPSATLPFLFDRNKLPQLYGIQGAFLALGTFFGSTIAGFFSDMGAAWLAVAYPGVLAALGCAMMYVTCPAVPARPRQKIDLLGIFMIFLIVAPTMFVSSFGKSMGWTNPWIIGALLLLVAAVIAFIQIEKRVQSPLIDLKLFKNAAFTGAVLCTFLLTWYQSSMRVYVPLVIQNVMGQSATVSGTVLLPRSIMNIIFPTICGAWIAKKQEARCWKGIFLTGLIIAAGMLMISFNSPSTSLYLFYIGLGITGIAESFKQSSVTPAMQAALPKESLGSGMSINSMSGTMGSTIAVCVFGILQSQVAPDASVVADLTKACNMIFLTSALTGAAVCLLAVLLIRPKKTVNTVTQP